MIPRAVALLGEERRTVFDRPGPPLIRLVLSRRCLFVTSISAVSSPGRRSVAISEDSDSLMRRAGRVRDSDRRLRIVVARGRMIADVQSRARRCRDTSPGFDGVPTAWVSHCHSLDPHDRDYPVVTVSRHANVPFPHDPGVSQGRRWQTGAPTHSLSRPLLLRRSECDPRGGIDQPLVSITHLALKLHEMNEFPALTTRINSAIEGGARELTLKGR